MGSGWMDGVPEDKYTCGTVPDKGALIWSAWEIIYIRIAAAEATYFIPLIHFPGIISVPRVMLATRGRHFTCLFYLMTGRRRISRKNISFPFPRRDVFWIFFFFLSSNSPPTSLILENELWWIGGLFLWRFKLCGRRRGPGGFKESQ